MMLKSLAIILSIRCSLGQGGMFTYSCSRMGEIHVFLHMLLTSFTLEGLSMLDPGLKMTSLSGKTSTLRRGGVVHIKLICTTYNVCVSLGMALQWTWKT